MIKRLLIPLLIVGSAVLGGCGKGADVTPESEPEGVLNEAQRMDQKTANQAPPPK